MDGQRPALPNGVHALIGGGLDPHLGGSDAQDFGHPLSDGRHMGRQLRALGDHHHVDVADSPSGPGGLIGRTAKDARRIHAFAGGIGIGKERADVTEAGCAEDGVGHRMEKHVGIGMSVGADVRGNRHAAEHAGPAGPERMDVKAGADSERRLRHARRMDPSGPEGKPWHKNP